ncbi:MAG: hypothetical protein KDD94_02245 [Calditrichaeota bacterium]|nr:hypothetical protein [Calditrichota bacterium]
MQQSPKKSNEKINSVYIVRQKELKISSHKKNFLKLELIDKDNKRLFGILWKESKKIYELISFGQAVKITSHPIKTGQNRLIEIDTIEFANESELNGFFDSNQTNPDDLAWLQKQLNDKKNPYQSILKKLFGTYIRKQFLLVPAGKLWIYNHQGGLFERSRTLIDWIEKLALADMDIYLMKSAVMIQSLAFIHGFHESKPIEYNNEARLIGLPGLALLTANKVIDSAEITAVKAAHLRHLILMMPQISNGTLHIEPQSREAFLLYDLQILQQNLIGIDGILKKEENKNRNWTTYNQLLKRFILNDQT